MSFVQTVTILITDLVGSTGLESRIGPKAADELRSEHFSLLRSAVDETGGREVKNRGDGLFIVFESASQAVSCAVAVQQRFERRNRTSDEQLSIRVGLSVGDATVTDGDYFGMSVTEAARLCDRAQGGQILAKELVGHLTGGRDGHAFKAIGELALKGFPEPVNAVEVAWEPLGEEGPSLPLPPRLQEMPPGGFVGRAVERRRLRELFGRGDRGRVPPGPDLRGAGDRQDAPLHPHRARSALPRGRSCSTDARTRNWPCPTAPGSRRSPITSSTPRRSCFGPTSSSTAAS